MKSVAGTLQLLACCWLFLGQTSGLPLPPVPETTGDERCVFCKDVVKILQGAVASNATLDDLTPLATTICVYAIEHLLDLGSYMCPGIVRSYGPVLLYVLAHKTLEPELICQALHFCPPNSSLKTDSRWTPMLEGIRKTIEPRLKDPRKLHLQKAAADASLSLTDGFEEPWQRGLSRNDIFKVGTQLADRERLDTRVKRLESDVITILQLADIHLDIFYAEGSPSDCRLYLCCRSWYNGTKPAGHYGAYECDLPMVTLDLLLDTIKQLDPQPDFIVYTGDSPPHDIWNETWTSQLDAIEFVVDHLREKLPNITIYPAMGNHETWPESEYLASLPQYQYLTKQLAEYWQKWVEFPPDALATIAKGGYYTIKIEEGLRLLSFNSDYGYSPNVYSFLNEDNQYYHEQWKWLTDQLTAAEQAGEKVLVISHVPPGDPSTWSEYGQFYLNTSRRFSKTIIGHMFGHTHEDEFHLLQDEAGIYGVVLAAPSVTTYGHINPSFRVFSMNRSSHQLLGYHQYHLNLTKANELAAQGIQPQFELAYTTSQEYGLKDLSPQSWAALVERFDEFDSLLDKYHYNKHGRSFPSDKTCSDMCKKEILCSVTNCITSEYIDCIE